MPLAAFTHYGPGKTPLAVNHQGLFVASTISFNLTAGKSLSDAVAAINEAMTRIGVPGTIHGTFQGTARAFQQSLANEPYLVLAALAAVYIVLGVLYESYVHPLTILSTLPSAGVGAVLALMAFNSEFSIIALIGVILLIGIVKKNAIMMIDFALDAERSQGLTSREAIYKACLLALSPDHDDHDGGAPRRGAAGDRCRRGRRAAPAARHLHRGRPDREPGPDALYDAGDLPLSRPLPALVPRDLERPASSGDRGPETHGGCVSMIPTKRHLRRIASMMALAALAGCAVGPDYKRPEAPAPAAFKEMNGWKPSEPKDAASNGPWWSIYGDPDLDALERQIDISNQNLRAAEAAFRQARALVAEARAAYFPTLSLGGSGQRSGQGRAAGSSASQTRSSGFVQNQFDLSASASWEVDVWGRIRRTVESQVASAQASAADLASARLSAQSELASDYFQLRVSDELKRLLDATVEADTRSLQITQNKYSAGTAAKSDVAQAQAQVEGVRAQAINVGVQRAQLEHAIAVLVGKPPSDFSLAPGPMRRGRAGDAGRSALDAAGAAAGYRRLGARHGGGQCADRRGDRGLLSDDHALRFLRLREQHAAEPRPDLPQRVVVRTRVLGDPVRRRAARRPGRGGARHL